MQLKRILSNWFPLVVFFTACIFMIIGAKKALMSLNWKQRSMGIFLLLLGLAVLILLGRHIPTDTGLIGGSF
jgi:hypothetical protein